MAAPPGKTACLPWYDLPEIHPAYDRFWSVLGGHLKRMGVRGVPARLTRGRAIPGLLSDPALLLGQCCGYDLIYGFAGCVKLVATPVFDAPGCDGARYRSLVLVRDDFHGRTLADLRGGVCVLNSYNSHSGTNALRALVAPLSDRGRFFSGVKVSGGHINSLAALQHGEADVMAMDCVTHALLSRHRPETLHGTRILCVTPPVPAPPFVTAATAGAERVDILRAAFLATVSDRSCRPSRQAMLLKGIEVLPLRDYGRIVELEGCALRHRYVELHATSALA